MAHMLNAAPRRSRGIKSATKPPPRVMGMQHARPIISRKAMSIGRFVLTAHSAVAIKKPAFETSITGLRPYASLIGEKTSGPTARPMMKTEMSSDAIAGLSTWNSAMA